MVRVLDAELRTNGFDHAVHSLRQGVIDHVVGLSSDDATRVAIDLVLMPSPPTPARRPDPLALARRAMQLARTRPADELLAAIRPGSPVRARRPELGLLIVHELVLGGHDAGPDDWYLAWARSTSHPLAILPPALLDIEQGFGRWRPTYAGQVTAYRRAAAAPVGAERRPLAAVLPGLGASLPVDRERITAPFRDWIERSNGDVVAAAYAPGGGFSAASGPPLGPDLPSSEIDVADGLNVLFSSAVSGGAYTSGLGGAFSRLVTWEAVAGILGRPWPAAIEGLADEIRRSRWIEMQADGPWFKCVAWDVFLAIELGERIVTVAATDLD